MASASSYPTNTWDWALWEVPSRLVTWPKFRFLTYFLSMYTFSGWLSTFTHFRFKFANCLDFVHKIINNLFGFVCSFIYLCPDSWATVNANPKPVSSLMVQLLYLLHIPPIGAKPAKKMTKPNEIRRVKSIKCDEINTWSKNPRIAKILDAYFCSHSKIMMITLLCAQWDYHWWKSSPNNKPPLVI